VRAPFAVDALECPPGEKVWGHIQLPAGADGEPYRCPIAVVHGRQDGPVLFVGGGTHGEELNGIESARRLAVEVDPEHIAGTLIVVPVQNPPAYLAFQHTTPWDDGDLGKAYPGSSEGSLTERIAYRLFESVISRANAAIDIHSAMKWGSEYPQCIVLAGSEEVHRTAAEIARCFPFRAIVSVRQEHLTLHFGPAYRRSLFFLLTERGIPSVLVEIGEGGKLNVSYVELALAGLQNAMRHLGMLPGAVEEYSEPVWTNEMLNVRSPTGGLLYLYVQEGEIVRAGDLVGKVVAVPDNETPIRAPSDGLVLRVATRGVVVPGDRVVVLGAMGR